MVNITWNNMSIDVNEGDVLTNDIICDANQPSLLLFVGAVVLVVALIFLIKKIWQDVKS